jgi:copper resistance protein B
MSRHLRNTSIVIRRPTLLFALSLVLPLMAAAQTAVPASSSSAPAGTDTMAGMDHGTMHHAATPAHADVVAPTHAEHHGALSEMDHAASAARHDHAEQDTSHGDHQHTPDMRHDAAPDAHAMSHMKMGPMQGGKAPADARSGDYSDGIVASPAHRLHMHGSAPSSMLLINQLEAAHGRDANGQGWELQAWYGGDSDKLWLRSEGERSRGKLEDGNLEVLWNHNISTFWGSQLGVRHDFGEGPARDWVAFGVQGLAPYWFEVEATGYVGTSGRTAARLRVEYEMLFTQRLILQPGVEINLYGRNDPQRRIGSGVSDIQFGLRLRYEVRRQFAPYIGVNWVRRVATSADYARQDQQPVLDRQIVAGFRIWF